MVNVTISHVSRAFALPNGETFAALADVSLDIEQGEFILMLGPSGCGKSTLLRLIAALDRPDAGEIRIDGSSGRRGFERVGVVFQQATLLPWLTVLDNVLYPARALGRSRAKEMRTRALDLIEMVGLSRVANQFPSRLSGGMQQRAAICRALLLDPDLLLMDEPFSALDAMTREELQFELLRIYQQTGKTIVFVTHSISEALLLSSRVVVMASGPGRIVDILANSLPLPRTLDMLAEPVARSADQRIRELIYSRPARGS
jgi:NitT/TauT family transport system ATP-binding protein